MKPIELTLPYPPSSNVYWRYYRGRVVPSKEAEAYKRTVGLLGLSKRVKKISGDLAVNLRVYRPQRSGDLSNRIKVLEDALQQVAYENDDQVVQLWARRFDDASNPRVEAVISEDQGELLCAHCGGWAR